MTLQDGLTTPINTRPSLKGMRYDGRIVVEAEQDAALTLPFDYYKIGFDHIVDICGRSARPSQNKETNMSDLQKKPIGTRGKVHQITPESAGWRYVGFSLFRLKAGDTAAEPRGDREVILVMVRRQSGNHWRRSRLGCLGRSNERFRKDTAPLPLSAQWHQMGGQGRN
jgi:hypothetical protein